MACTERMGGTPGEAAGALPPPRRRNAHPDPTRPSKPLTTRRPYLQHTFGPHLRATQSSPCERTRLFRRRSIRHVGSENVGPSQTANTENFDGRRAWTPQTTAAGFLIDYARAVHRRTRAPIRSVVNCARAAAPRCSGSIPGTHFRSLLRSHRHATPQGMFSLQVERAVPNSSGR